nr:hypothetical protein pPsy0462b_00094 [Pseudomonas syringae]
MIGQSPDARFGQNPVLAEMAGLKIRHDAFMSAVEGAFGDDGQGVLMELLDAHAVGQALRAQVDRLGTSEHWYPLLPDDPITPHGVRNGDDHTPFSGPSAQFSADEPGHGDQRQQAVRQRNVAWQPVGGSGASDAADLCQAQSVGPRGVPWRVRMDIMPGGIKSLGVKKTR